MHEASDSVDVPRLLARLRPGYLVRWQAENARTDWTGPRTRATASHGASTSLRVAARRAETQLINIRLRNAISACSLAHPFRRVSCRFCRVPFLPRGSWVRFERIFCTCIFSRRTRGVTCTKRVPLVHVQRASLKNRTPQRLTFIECR